MAGLVISRAALRLHRLRCQVTTTIDFDWPASRDRQKQKFSHWGDVVGLVDGPTNECVRKSGNRRRDRKRGTLRVTTRPMRLVRAPRTQ